MALFKNIYSLKTCKTNKNTLKYFIFSFPFFYSKWVQIYKFPFGKNKDNFAQHFQDIEGFCVS